MELPELTIKREDEGCLHIIPNDETDFLAFVDLANSPELREQISKEIVHRCKRFDGILFALKQVNEFLKYNSTIPLTLRIEEIVKKAISKAEGRE